MLPNESRARQSVVAARWIVSEAIAVAKANVLCNAIEKQARIDRLVPALEYCNDASTEPLCLAMTTLPVLDARLVAAACQVSQNGEHKALEQLTKVRW